MAKIINSKKLGISKEQMKNLYRNNLIFCNDYELIVATVPNWAMNEVESILGYEIDGLEIDDNRIPADKIDMLQKNRYSYPGLFKSIFGE